MKGKKKGKKIIGTHHAPDLDSIAAITLFRRYGNKEQSEAVVAIYLRKGDEPLMELPGVTLIDRGKGKFDHHGINNRWDKKGQPETSTSLVAKALNVAEEKVVQRLLRKIQRSDLEGESLPFDISDLIKCMQRLSVENRKIVEIGTRIVEDCLQFSEKKLLRENTEIQKIIKNFLKRKKVVPPKFQQYLENLSNPNFERPFDIGEIFVAERHKGQQNKGIAKKLVEKLLEFEYQDSLNYLKAVEEELPKAEKIRIKWALIVIYETDNPRFKDAARNILKATIVIQRNSDRHTQIFFDIKRINDKLVETLVSMIRLEECLIQKREIPKEDLRKPEWVSSIPEWYYYKAPWIPGKKKKSGRFILNGSITAPDVPASKISLETLKHLATCAVLYHRNFNWPKWIAERIAYYLNH